jgi:hypothetical protein
MTLNISINQLDKNYVENLKTFLTVCMPDFKLILTHNPIDEETLTDLNNKFGKNITI